MNYDEIQEVLKLNNWAVVGATNRTEKYGYKIFKKLITHGKTVFPINPRLEEIEGIKVYKELKEIHQKIDVVNFVVNPAIGINFVKECKELGIKYIWLQPGTISDELLKYASESDIITIDACVLVMLR
ncbi:MAG TPA: CoA-binding protein [Clostridiales bacterium]|nr:MAG: hypothetical protein A2Y18_02240 [Clostridiales bacterium GWD2_32_19]HCC07516.1 CoA-binding protein [Clostridiales bacterium]